MFGIVLINMFLRTKYDRLHSISSVSPLWYGQKYFKPSKNFSNNDSFQRIRFGNKPLDNEVNEMYQPVINKVPNSFQKFCNLMMNNLIWVSEVAIDQFGNKLKSYYGFLQNDNKKIQCVYQELDNENSIKWIYL